VKKGVLHAVNGAFSSKWATVSKACGYHTQNVEFNWGCGVAVAAIDAALSTGEFDVFAMVHNETSTGVKSDLDAISNLLKTKYPDVLWLVDAVSSMAGIKIEVDNLGIDFILASTQKAWGLPAGFAICAISDRMIEKSTSLENKGYFLDALHYEKSYGKAQTPSTPSIPHLFALQKVLDIIDVEGLDNRWKRHKDCAEYAQNWALAHGQSLYPEKGCESETLTCIQNDQQWDINNINDILLTCGFRMDCGYGNLRGKAFRVAHMGNVYMNDLVEYLNKFDEVLEYV
jgi:aspartate aminotransferase-like enzyme